MQMLYIKFMKIKFDREQTENTKSAERQRKDF